MSAAAVLVETRALRLRAIAGDLPLCQASVRAAFEAGQFELAYQPILRTRDLTLVGCEALLRWNHPARGAQATRQFIPIIERSLLAAEVGEWVLTRAATQVRRWQDAGALRLSVNVASLQALAPDFATRVQRSLDRSGLSPERLRLEITQDLVTDHPQKAAPALALLAVMGVRTDLDDFGGGPTLLRRLRSLAISGVKLDRRFLEGISSAQPAPGNDARVLVGLARAQGLRVVAESVETETEFNAIAGMGIEEAQGHLFCPALSAAAFEDYLGLRGKGLELPGG